MEQKQAALALSLAAAPPLSLQTLQLGRYSQVAPFVSETFRPHPSPSVLSSTLSVLIMVVFKLDTFPL